MLQFADVAHPDVVHSSHALDALVDIYAEEEDKKKDAAQVRRVDPIPPTSSHLCIRSELIEHTGIGSARAKVRSSSSELLELPKVFAGAASGV